MGWLIGWGTKDALVKHLLAQEGGNCEVIDHSVRGNNLWMLLRRKTDGFKFICLCMLTGRNGGGPPGRDWGYKDVEESMGPCETDCPERLLAQSDDTADYAVAWRQRCRDARKKEAAHKKFIAGLKKGDKFQWGDHTVTFHEMVDHQRWNGRNTRYITGYAENDDTLYRWRKIGVRPLEQST